MKKVLIRYNTENNGKELFWRALIDGEEHLADSIDIQVPCQTTRDTLPNGIIKFHITCYGSVSWAGSKLVVYEAKSKAEETSY